MDTTTPPTGDTPVHLTPHDTYRAMQDAVEHRDVWTTSPGQSVTETDGTVTDWTLSFYIDPDYDDTTGRFGLEHGMVVKAMRDIVVMDESVHGVPAHIARRIAEVVHAPTRGTARAALHALDRVTIDLVAQVAVLGMVVTGVPDAPPPQADPDGPLVVPMINGEAAGMVRGGPMMHATLGGGKVLLRGPARTGQVPTPAELDALEKNTPVVRLSTPELLDVLEGRTVSTTVSYGTRRGEPVEVRLATADELLELNRLAGAYLSAMMGDRAPGWEMPPPLTRDRAVELSTPTPVTADQRRSLVAAFPSHPQPDPAELRHTYPWVRAWGLHLGSSPEWAETEARRAYHDGVPTDVIHRDEWDDVTTHGRQETALQAERDGHAVIVRHPLNVPCRVWWRASSITVPDTADRVARLARNIAAGRDPYDEGTGR